MEQKGVTKTQRKEAIMMRDYVKEKVLARGRKVSMGFGVRPFNLNNVVSRPSINKKPRWGEPIRAMMRNQRCDRIERPSRS